MQRTEPFGGRLIQSVDRMAPRGVPWALGAALCAMCWVWDGGVTMGVELPWPWDQSVALLPGTVAGLAAVQARRRRWPLFAVAVVSWPVLYLWPVPFVAAYYAGTSLRRRVHVVVFAVLAVGAVGVPIMIRGLATSATGVVAFVAIVVFLPLATGLWVAARRQVRAEVREHAERSRREQAARADSARYRERARIAREMHDVVAHHVSLMVLHAGALEVRSDDEQVVREATLISESGRSALTGLRETLGVLRARQEGDAMSPQPVLTDLPGLLERSRSAGLTVRLCTDGATRPLPVEVERAGYRVVQEALTNVHKHAPGARTVVTTEYLPDALNVSVRNEPAERATVYLPGNGLGLTGLRERVELLGGTLDATGARDGGFTVRARIPEVPA